jgi:UTP--glucose-1-phosphate uridylyltransferase
MQKITKAIIPAAGLGTRFLPQTKAMPKEMLPLIDKPIIQYVVEEAVSAGITDIIIVTGAGKRAIEDHFDHAPELERSLDEKGKTAIAQQLRGIGDLANFIYLRQKGGQGTGVPVLNAAPILDGEPFLVLYGDDVFRGAQSRAAQLVEAYEKYQTPILSLIPITPEETNQYGVPAVGGEIEPGLHRVTQLVEKPGPHKAPSHFGAISGYVLNRDIIDLLETQPLDEKSGELYLTDAINEYAKTRPVYGKVLEGTWHDTGDKVKYLRAVIDYALADPKLAPDLARYFEQALQNHKHNLSQH